MVKYIPYFVSALLAAILFAATLQTDINSDDGPYTIDVGEIQNALPAWGTLHPFGYPQYSATGSLIVSIVRLFDVNPATATSLVSLLWGVLAVGLVTQLALDLGANQVAAVLGALFFAASRSIWVDSSIAEVHTLTMVFTIGTLLYALRFARMGQRVDLAWMLFFSSQGVIHSRSIAFLVPAVLMLIAAHWRVVVRNIPLILGFTVLALATYLYISLREAMGAEWMFFQQTTTVPGFIDMILHVKAEDLTVAQSWSEWGERFSATVSLHTDDLPLPVLLPGLIGVFAYRRRDKRYWQVVLGLTLAWIPYSVLSLFMWRPGVQVHDALLAIKLPTSLMAGLGLALLLSRIKYRAVTAIAAIGLLAMVAYHYPEVRAITRDNSIQAIITEADRSESGTAVYASWGNQYWALAYAQSYQDRLEGVRLVNHRTDPATLWDQPLLVLRDVFYSNPIAYWEELAGQLFASQVLYPDLYAPNLVELRRSPRESADPAIFIVNNDLSIVAATLEETKNGEILVFIQWRAEQKPQRDYSIAVHLVSENPPADPQQILDQADKTHPVEGLYPTSQWETGQVVQDVYSLAPPDGSEPVAVRVTAYYVSDTFINGEWFSLNLE